MVLGRLLAGPPAAAATRLAVKGPAHEAWTYAELAARARGVGREIAGLAAGDAPPRVALRLAEPRELLAALVGTLEAGGVAVPLDPRAPARDGAERIARARPALVLDGLPAEPAGSALAAAAPAVPARRAPDDEALLLFTSGSTGRPKGVRLSRRSVAWNVGAILGYLPVSRAPRTAVVLPLAYAYTLVGQALVTFAAGATLEVLSGLPPAEQVAALRADRQPTGLSSVAPGLRWLAEAALDAGGPLEHVAYVGCAGGPLDGATLELVRAAFPRAETWSQYGLTEAGPRVAALRADDEAFAPGIAGRPLPGVELRLRADGELEVRGPGVMLGYLDDDAATGDVLDREGWLRTGDVAERDEASGLVRLLGRRDGVVKVAGERVGVEEIEEALRGCAGIGDAVVVPLPDPRLGARLVALVAGSREALLAARRALVATLPPAKRPLAAYLVEAVPRTRGGKLDRATARRLAEVHDAPGAGAGAP